MPKLYDYLGLVIFFYSNEHEPIHVHARKGETEGKVEIYVEKGVVVYIKYKKVNGKKGLNKRDKANFVTLVSILADEIVQNWINYFVLHKKIIPKNIAGVL